MYVLATQLKNLPVLSLQTGQQIASINKPVVQDSSLEVLALQCRLGRLGRQEGVILMRDIRQVASDCVILDSFDEIEDIKEIVRLREVAIKNFNPIGKLVVNESGQKLGKVEDYTINLKTFLLQKLYVHQSVMKSFLFNNLVIDRTQIIDVSPKQFTVRDVSVKQPALAPAVPKSSN